MNLLDLPTEILCSLPLYLHDIETFTNAASSCRQLRDAFSHTRPKTILHLAAGSAPTFFSPHPRFLVALTARQASDWALGDPDRTRLLREAFRGGIHTLYQFCLDHAGLTLEDIRRAHLARFSIINRLSDKIDKMAGNQWLNTPNFWDGGVSEAYTICAEADRTTMEMIIYGELFGRSMEAFLQPDQNLPYFDIATRLDYLTYCVPESFCQSYPEFEVLPVGPYKPGTDPELADEQDKGDQVVLWYVLKCGRWRRMWAAAIRSLLDLESEFSDEDLTQEPWDKRLLRDALQIQGLDGMQLVTLPKEEISTECWQKARKIASQIKALKGPPGDALINSHPRYQRQLSLAPSPWLEVYVAVQTYWG
ncbi:hypothetical protein N7492_002919 [Penicillium capsulatum]|uniref:F-box domain-containing protein n=1 Tax=Penicillium capsulatum TaxID=69766 RepID=A0A9W9LWG6_9EURO|nr:hypothetical protein N7492_002919 [Penicillium capsulatum]KAJ6122487.1 hypothetical protein N7512_004952 [Penicillium capsulatum]